jgi:hypothetical protein
MSTKDQKIYEQAVQLNNKSYRKAQRIIKQVKELGMKGVNHKGIGKVPYNKTLIDTEIDVHTLSKGKIL